MFPRWLRKWIRDTKAKSSSSAIVGLMIAMILAGSIFVSGINFIINANTTGWTTPELAMWVIIPIIAMVGLIILLLKEVGITI
jgi:hypothetical protein